MGRKISIVTACYNEEENVELLYEAVKSIFQDLGEYEYEHIFIDNASTDRTVPILKEIAERDKNVKIIVNARNFGHIRSPFHGLIQAKGDAVISLVADFQDPPDMIPDFIEKWNEGCKVVVGVKKGSEENPLLFLIRRIYYYFIEKLSDVKQIKNFTGFGLYDKKIIEQLRLIDDPYPYMRGLISEIGYDICQIEYQQPVRKRGITKNNFYSLYDMAMLGITSYSKIPLRLATLIGFTLAIISLIFAFFYTVYKLIYWYSFDVGIAPLVIGLFFFSAVQLFFIGVIGEYVGSIQTRVMKRPLVIERERINFNEDEK